METLIQAFKAYSYDTDVTYDTVDKTKFIYYEKTSELIDDGLKTVIIHGQSHKGSTYNIALILKSFIP